jgi:hypothetical protein
MKEAVIVSGARTPIGKAKKGSLRTVRPDDLGAYAVRETLKRAGGYEGNIDDLIIGCATPEAEQGLNTSAISARLPGCRTQFRPLRSTDIVLQDFNRSLTGPKKSCLELPTRSLPAALKR